MARINIEDSLFKDTRWTDLIIKIGCQYTALGVVTQSWILAQEHWIQHRAVPVKAWPEKLNVLIDVGLAEKISDDLIYVKGSKKAFSWLEQRVEAGRKGGLAKRAPKKDKVVSQAVAKKLLASDNHPPKPAKPLTLTPTLTLDQSLTHNLDLTHTHNPTKLKDRGNTKISIDETEKKSNATNQNRKLNQDIWTAYQSAYRTRYGVEPTRNAKINSQISQLAKRLGQDAIGVISFFINHTDGYYISKCHPVGLCLQDAEALRTQWLRGKAITRTDIKRFEQTQERYNLRQAIERGEI